MKISATIDLPRGYIHYEYDTVANEHCVTVWEPFLGILKPSRKGGSSGFVTNALVPYRDIPEVVELVSYLNRRGTAW